MLLQKLTKPSGLASAMTTMRKPPVGRKLKSMQQRPFCNYVHRICMQERLEGYEYCIRHILEDRTAPFRQCSYVHLQNGKRCSNAAPRSDKKDSTLCPWHSKVAHRNKRPKKRSRTPVESPETLLESLEHHCKGNHSTDKIVANKIVPTVQETSGEFLPKDDAWKGEAESDAESIDNEHENPLKHAGVYTAEEVTLITRDKMIRLQSLYISQFKRIKHFLKERRRLYLQAVKEPNERVVMCRKLAALQNYHNPHGREALLQQKSRERRKLFTEGANYNPPAVIKCSSLDNGNRCANRVLPFTKFCLKHILLDSSQVLYQPCREDCKKPVLPALDFSNCLLHASYHDAGKLHNWVKNTSKSVSNQEPDLFQAMDDIAALGLDVVQPCTLFGLDQFGELGDTLCEDLMFANDILCETRKSPENTAEKEECSL